MPAVTNSLRPWICVLPQPGWGGCTLPGFIEGIGLRPDAHGSGEEIAAVLDGLVAAGHAQPVAVEDDEEPRWELTPDSHDELTAHIDPAEGATPAAVLLELQPGVTVSTTSAEVK